MAQKSKAWTDPWIRRIQANLQERPDDQIYIKLSLSPWLYEELYMGSTNVWIGVCVAPSLAITACKWLMESSETVGVCMQLGNEVTQRNQIIWVIKEHGNLVTAYLQVHTAGQ